MLTRIDNEVKSARDRNILKFIYTECKATDDIINAMIGVTNDRNLYGAKVFDNLMWIRRKWPNPGSDPIEADQVERTKDDLKYRLQEFQYELNNYLKDSEDPGKYEYYQNKVQNNKLRGTLRLLYVICGVSKEIIDNMIHVINNPDLYNDEIRQSLKNIDDMCNGFNRNNAGVKQTLKQRLKNDAMTYFRNPNKYLNPNRNPQEIQSRRSKRSPY